MSCIPGSEHTRGLMESCNSGRSHEPQTEDEFSDGPRWPGLSRVPGRTERGNDAVGEPPCPGSVSLMSLSRPHASCSGQLPREPHVRQGRREGLAHPGRQGCPPPQMSLSATWSQTPHFKGMESWFCWCVEDKAIPSGQTLGAQPSHGACKAGCRPVRFQQVPV